MISDPSSPWVSFSPALEKLNKGEMQRREPGLHLENHCRAPCSLKQKDAQRLPADLRASGVGRVLAARKCQATSAQLLCSPFSEWSGSFAWEGKQIPQMWGCGPGCWLPQYFSLPSPLCSLFSDYQLIDIFIKSSVQGIPLPPSFSNPEA